MLQVFDLYISIGCVDGERRAPAIEFSPQLMALSAGLVVVHRNRKNAIHTAIAGMHVEVGGKVPGNANGHRAI